MCDFEGEPRFGQLGINLTLLEPGQPMTMYHREADQEDFLILSGEALLVIEGEERTLRQWDFVHCPPGTNHAIIGAGTARCLVLAVGARDNRSKGLAWGAYTVDEPRCATAQASNARQPREARRTRDSRPGSWPSSGTACFPTSDSPTTRRPFPNAGAPRVTRRLLRAASIAVRVVPLQGQDPHRSTVHGNDVNRMAHTEGWQLRFGEGRPKCD